MLGENIMVFKDLAISSNSNNKSKCFCDSNNLDYYHEIENYKSKLKESANCNTKLELEITELKDRFKRESIKLNEELTRQRDKYERLLESHRRISRLNHDLEERILLLIDKFNTEKSESESNYKEISSKYECAQTFITELQTDCERYRNDCMTAVQLLQNNPSSFLSRHIETLPIPLRNRLNEYQNELDLHNSFGQENFYSNNGKLKNQNTSNTYIPISTFPPTAMMFSDSQTDKRRSRTQPNLVCASVLAEILHPDKVANHQKSVPDNKCTIEIVCNRCGTIKDYRNASVQTIPPILFDNNTNQKPQKANQNIIFDV